MRELRESRPFALSILFIVGAVALLIGAESVRSDGPLPIQRVPAVLEINGRDANGEWSLGKYIITDEELAQTFVDTLNRMEKTEVRKSFDMMEVDWDVYIAGYSGYGWSLELAPDTMRVSGVGVPSKVYEADCGPLYELLDEIVQLRRSGKID